MTDKLVEGEWVWETSMSLLSDTGFSDWGNNEPNNHDEENCGALSDDRHYQWVDTDCYDEAHFICEIK